MSQPIIFQVKQSRSEEIDVELEGVAAQPPPPSKLSAAGAGDINLVPDGMDDNDDAAEAEEKRTSFMSRLASPLVNKKTATAVALFVVVGTIVGVAIGGAAEYKQQQNAFVAINGGGGANRSKAGKSGSFCEPASVITCGETFTNEVILSDNLICTDVIDANTPNTELRRLNAAIKVEGANAVIDCKGHTISQITSKSAAACATNPGFALTRSDNRKQMKKDCDLYYQVGIILLDGATAIDCKVEQFYEGFLVVNGGEVKGKKSEAYGNKLGVYSRFTSGAIATKISDVHAHHNYNGILASASSNQNDATIEDVTSKNNFNLGLGFRGPGMKVKDSVSSYNGESGIKMSGEDQNKVTVVQIQGMVSSHHNKVHGIEVAVGNGGPPDKKFAQVIVTGVLNTYLNTNSGLIIRNNVNMFNPTYAPNGFTVEDSGSFNACQNDNYDIFNGGKVNFVDMGMGMDGYTCNGAKISLGANGEGLPACEDCPACDN